MEIAKSIVASRSSKYRTNWSTNNKISVSLCICLLVTEDQSLFHLKSYAIFIFVFGIFVIALFSKSLHYSFTVAGTQSSPHVSMSLKKEVSRGQLMEGFGFEKCHLLGPFAHVMFLAQGCDPNRTIVNKVRFQCYSSAISLYVFWEILQISVKFQTYSKALPCRGDKPR